MKNHRTTRWIAGLGLLLLAGLACLFALIFLRQPGARAGSSFLGFESEDYKVYPTAASPLDFYGRVYQRTRIERIKLQPADTAAAASALVGFPVRSPGQLPQGMEPVSSYDTQGKHSIEVEFNFAEARRILSESGLPVDRLPAGDQPMLVTVDIPPGVVIHQSQGDSWFTLLQGKSGQVHQPEGSDPATLEALSELGLRKLGLTEEPARLLSQELGWAAFLVTPPADMFHAELASVNGVPALVLYQSGSDTGMHAVVWVEAGVIYGLYGSLPVAKLLEMAESLE